MKRKAGVLEIANRGVERAAPGASVAPDLHGPYVTWMESEAENGAFTPEDVASVRRWSNADLFKRTLTQTDLDMETQHLEMIRNTKPGSMSPKVHMSVGRTSLRNAYVRNKTVNFLAAQIAHFPPALPMGQPILDHFYAQPQGLAGGVFKHGTRVPRHLQYEDVPIASRTGTSTHFSTSHKPTY